MKSAILYAAVWITLGSLSNIAQSQAADTEQAGQRRGSEPMPDRHQEGVRHDSRAQESREFSPQSHVPPRSPDLGLPTSPLSPSTSGPGSGLLGLESGPGPAQRRSMPETGSNTSPRDAGRR